MRKSCLLLICFLITAIVHAQSVGINNDGSPPNPNAMLDIKSNTKGLLVPRLTTAQRNAMTSVQGMLVYDTDVNKFFYNNGSAWTELSTGSATNFWTANATNIHNNNVGNVGIGISTPLTPLHVYNSTADELVRLEGNNPYVGFRLAGGTLRSYVQGYINDLLVGTASGNPTGKIMFYNNNVANMTILPNGFVGIGTVTPNSGLEMRGTSFGAQQRITDVTSGNSLVLQSGSGTGMRVTGYNYGTATAQPIYIGYDGANTYLNPNGGSVGIGTNTPTGGYLLDVAGPVKSFGNTTHFVAQTTGGINTWARFYMRGSSQSWFMGTSQDYVGNQLYIGDETFGHTRFSIQPNNGPIYMSGSLGINIYPPSSGYILDVAGPVKSIGNTTHFVAQTNGGTNSWARYYMRSPSQSWFMGTSENFIGNQFYLADETFNHTRFTIHPNNGLIWMSTATGVGINTTNTSGYMLAVNGKIRSTEIVVETGWADYVFDKNYKLKPLNELEKFIQLNKHLPNIPPAYEIATNGLNVGDVQKRMMEKIEELTLYIIQLKKEIDEIKNTSTK